ncbi:alpha/beta fold hydrolase [Rhodococcus sp. NPDC056960]|uniref:alpha/beta fold hydrolase n=1 Tax=Rhodococcus TaxID=1827 RepID=UPI00362FCE72
MRAPGDRTRLVLTADGTSLAVREIGSRMAPVTVIFAHGFCLHMDAWAPQRACLAEAWRGRARLVFFDHRGHGGSGAAVTDSYTISQLGRDLDAVIRTVAPKGPIVLVGHSMGGMAVMSYIAHHQEAAAAQVVGAGLISTAVDNVAGAGIGRALNTPAVTLLRSASAHAPGLVGRSWNLSRRILSPVVGATCPLAPSASVRAAATSYGMVHATPIATVAAFLRDLRIYDASPALDVLAEVPASIICGTRDRVTPIGHSQRLAAALPLAELIPVSGARHMVGLERPDVVNESLDRLLGRAVGRREQDTTRRSKSDPVGA